MKLALFEFEDLNWFPEIIRDGMTGYLRYLFNKLNFYGPATTLLKEILDNTNSTEITDLCSGGGGPIERIQQNLKAQFNVDVRFKLTDKFPNIVSYKAIQKRAEGKITFDPLPVDASNVPPLLGGVRTMFSAFHHFDQDFGKAVIKNAVDAGKGIAIFDGGDRNIFMILAIILFTPIVFFFFTPFFRPLNLGVIFFTYIIPIIPFCTIWDGIVSIIKLYKPSELLALANEVDRENYIWKAGKVRNKLGMNIAYLTGFPV